MTMAGDNLVKRKWIVVSGLLAGVGGFALWYYYRGPGEYWLRFFVSCSIYEIFWCMVGFYFFNRRRYITKIVISVFFVTCVLEVLQLWNPPLLLEIRRTLIGMAVLGTSFFWTQFPFYIVGCIIAWKLMWVLPRERLSGNIRKTIIFLKGKNGP